MLSHDEIQRIAAGDSPIRVMREHRGMTAKRLAKEAGMRLDQLERVEKNRATVRPDRLQRIADVLGVHVIDLRDCHRNFRDCADKLRWVED